MTELSSKLTTISPILRTALLLFASNIFMTCAWYGHLKFKPHSVLMAIGISWLLALPEYALHVPANRFGYGALSAYQLKILQESITLIVFMIFAWLALGESPTWRSLLSFALVFLAVIVGFSGRN